MSENKSSNLFKPTVCLHASGTGLNPLHSKHHLSSSQQASEAVAAESILAPSEEPVAQGTHMIDSRRQDRQPRSQLALSGLKASFPP